MPPRTSGADRLEEGLGAGRGDVLEGWAGVGKGAEAGAGVKVEIEAGSRSRIRSRSRTIKRGSGRYVF